MRIGWGPRATVTVVLVGLAACWGVTAVWVVLAPRGGGVEELLHPTAVTAFAVIGGLVVWQRPRHAVGWLLLGVGTFFVTGWAAEVWAREAALSGHVGWSGTLAAWYGEWYWLVYLHLMLVQLPLRFPTGRPLSPRWGWFGRFDLAVLATTVLAAMTQSTLHVVDTARRELVTLPNPIGLLPIGDIEDEPWIALSVTPIHLFAVLALASLVARYVRARGVERRQLEVALTGFAVVVVIFVANAVSEVAFDRQLGGLAEVAINLVVPLALGLAVLRHRLWELDRLVSRTLAYAAVTLVLAGAYGLIVLTASSILGPRDAPAVVVAAATLFCAALFRPVRNRVQAVADRRFDRRRYDAIRVVEGFGQRTRDEVDLAELAADLHATVTAAVRPVSASVWFVDAPEDGS